MATQDFLEDETIYYDVTDGDPITHNSSTKRYIPGRPSYPDEDTRHYAVRVKPEDNPYADEYLPSGVRRRSTATTDHALRAQQSQRGAGPRYLPDEQYNAVQRRMKQPQVSTRQRQRTAQPERFTEPQRVVTGQHKRFYVAPGIARVVVGCGICLCCACIPSLATMPISGGVHVLHQYAQGVNPSVVLSHPFGHNHDSIEKPTILRAMVNGNHIDFEEIPAGDISKTHGFQTLTFKEMGYTGDLSQVYLEIIPEHVSAGKIQIRLQATMGGVGAWPFVQSVNKYWILTDNGNFFVPPTIPGGSN